MHSAARSAGFILLSCLLQTEANLDCSHFIPSSGGIAVQGLWALQVMRPFFQSGGIHRKHLPCSPEAEPYYQAGSFCTFCFILRSFVRSTFSFGQQQQAWCCGMSPYLVLTLHSRFPFHLEEDISQVDMSVALWGWDTKHALLRKVVCPDKASHIATC